jgi:hypothetical protein
MSNYCERVHMKRKSGRLLAISSLILLLSFSITSAQAMEVAGASATTTGNLLVFFWSTERSQLEVVDVSASTRRKVSGSVVRWRTREQESDVEHVAGVSPGSELLVFSWSTQASSVHDWRVVNVSTVTQRICRILPADHNLLVALRPRPADCSAKILGPVTYWQTPDGPFVVDHIAGVSPSGELQVIYWSTQANSEEDWQLVNVSALTQRKASGPLTNWQTQEGRFNVEHVAAASPDGDLLVFSWSPATDWRVFNASGFTPIGIRPRIAGPLTSWKTYDPGLGLGTVDHVAAASPSGDLLVFFRRVGLDLVLNRAPTWQFVNVSGRTQQKIEACTQVGGPPCGVMDSLVAENGDEIITAVEPGNQISIFFSLAADRRDIRWGVCDITKRACTNPR